MAFWNSSCQSVNVVKTSELMIGKAEVTYGQLHCFGSICDAVGIAGAPTIRVLSQYDWAVNQKRQFKPFEETVVATVKTSEFRKGLKVQIDGDPYIMTECQFVKPGKGNAFYKCRLRNLVRNTSLDRTYKGGDSLETADIHEISAQYLYRQGDMFVFMDDETFEQYELTSEQIDDGWKYLIEGMKCSMMLYNNAPIGMEPPNHVVLTVEYCEPGAKGNTATNVTKPVKVQTGGEFQCPAFINIGDNIKIDTRTGAYVERVKV